MKLEIYTMTLEAIPICSFYFLQSVIKRLRSRDLYDANVTCANSEIR